MAETQPQLHPALLRLSAIVSQYFTWKQRSIAGYGVYWMNFPGGEISSAVSNVAISERVLARMIHVEECLPGDSHNRVYAQRQHTARLETFEKCVPLAVQENTIVRRSHHVLPSGSSAKMRPRFRPVASANSKWTSPSSCTLTSATRPVTMYHCCSCGYFRAECLPTPESGRHVNIPDGVLRLNIAGLVGTATHSFLASSRSAA